MPSRTRTTSPPALAARARGLPDRARARRRPGSPLRGDREGARCAGRHRQVARPSGAGGARARDGPRGRAPGTGTALQRRHRRSHDASRTRARPTTSTARCPRRPPHACEDHLRTCATCRREVDLARPRLETPRERPPSPTPPPGLADAAIAEAAGSPRLAPRRSGPSTARPRTGRGPPHRGGWPSLGAAAVIALIAVARAQARPARELALLQSAAGAAAAGSYPQATAVEVQARRLWDGHARAVRGRLRRGRRPSAGERRHRRSRRRRERRRRSPPIAASRCGGEAVARAASRRDALPGQRLRQPGAAP